MHGVFIVAIFFGGIVLALAVVGATILTAMKMRHGGLSRKGQQNQAAEAELIQEIYHGLERLQERVEALETIMMDRQRKD